MSMERRNTIQKSLVHNAVVSLHGHATADEAYEVIKEEHSSIGRGTVYRNLRILAEEGLIRKVEIPSGPDRFDFTLEKHYHVRCVRCNNIFDVDFDVIPNLISRIKNKNGIRFIDYDILFKGICSDCQKNLKEI